MAAPFRRRLLVIVVLAFAVSVITGPANSVVFLFAQNFLHQPGIVTAAMVAGAGVAGLAGLLAGYILGVFAGSVFAPAAGALVNELFPTSVRASVAGWSLAAGVLGAVTGLVVFGAVAGAGHRFGMAGLVTFLPAALAMMLFGLLPETCGREPEDLWPGP